MSNTNKQIARTRLLYDPSRAIEHAQRQPRITPVRLFSVLFPLWKVETTAFQEEGRPYKLLEQYIERGIEEGQLHTIEELANFFALQPAMVEKVLKFLRITGHVTCKDSFWYLTPLGEKSLRAGRNFVAKEKRMHIYFDAFLSKPLRTEHYKKRAHILASDEADEVMNTKTWNTRFRLIFGMYPWQEASLPELERRNDREDYNIPPEARMLQVLQVNPAYIPMHIIEGRREHERTAMRRPYYLAYTNITGWRDEYFEDIINNNQAVYAVLRSEGQMTQHKVWQEWLKEREITEALPVERADGTWRITLPASTFDGKNAKFSLMRIGGYDLRYGYFIQLWCESQALRRKAAIGRALRMVRSNQQSITHDMLQEQLNLLMQQLEVDDVQLADLRQQANETAMHDVLQVLEHL